ncbi:DUF5050 domain-containing protein [Neobacillus drentensis]|uniref:DUF5050 domain-containing protein n=1 Tax=Neobacillus drentensis TaxID=220684 RepID=UPI00285FC0EC|nr:DUF5050 domain-containing protein [Neobacillus drentensis]MDR7240846.1 sugar lactone lactonase YvrE [Neobacillus drentensis]
MHKIIRAKNILIVIMFVFLVWFLLFFNKNLYSNFKFSFDKPNKIGNSYANIMNDGYVATQDEWIFFKKETNCCIPFLSAYSLIAKKKGEATTYKIASGLGGYINIIGNDVVYTHMQFPDIGNMYMFNLKTKRKYKLADSVYSVQVIGNWIYYVDYTHNGIYKMNIKNREPIHLFTFKDQVVDYFVDGSNIYIYCYDDNKLYRLSSNGNHLETIGLPDYSTFFMAGFDKQFIYYQDVTNLYRINKWNGMGKELIVTNTLSISFADDDYIYYSENKGGGYLYRIEKNGKNKKLILRKSDITHINIHGKWIYYRIGVKEKIYRVKTNGTKDGLFQ